MRQLFICVYWIYLLKLIKNNINKNTWTNWIKLIIFINSRLNILKILLLYVYGIAVTVRLNWNFLLFFVRLNWNFLLFFVMSEKDKKFLYFIN